MKVAIVKLNAELAKKYLAKNQNNRAMSTKHLIYAKDMQEGRWKENGESIIIDRNGLIKDGQHRLQATIEANHEWTVPVVSDVDPDVMHTIDTGKNRTLADVLEINGFTIATLKASLIKKIIQINVGTDFYSNGGTGFSKKDKYIKNKRNVTNGQGLEFALKNKILLDDLSSISQSLYSKQPVKIYTKTEIGVFVYLITKGKNMRSTVITNFMKLILGITSDEFSASTWFYKKMVKYKTSKEKVSNKWVTGIFIKCWNLYLDGNPPVRSLAYNIQKPLPTINKLEVEFIF